MSSTVCPTPGVRIGSKATTHTITMTIPWKESLLSTTDPQRLLAFASYAAGSLSSRELDAAQTRLRRLPTDDVVELRIAALSVAQEASDIIDEQRFFGNRSVSRDGWDAWWVAEPTQPVAEAAPAAPKYYVRSNGLVVSGIDSLPLPEAVKVFHKKYPDHEKHLYRIALDADCVVAYKPKGSVYWSGTPNVTTPEEFEALRHWE